jgi:hypothetical protein
LPVSTSASLSAKKSPRLVAPAEEARRRALAQVEQHVYRRHFVERGRIATREQEITAHWRKPRQCRGR